MIKRRAGAAGAPALDVLPHVPGDGDHGVPVERGDARAQGASASGSTRRLVGKVLRGRDARVSRGGRNGPRGGADREVHHRHGSRSRGRSSRAPSLGNSSARGDPRAVGVWRSAGLDELAAPPRPPGYDVPRYLVVLAELAEAILQVEVVGTGDELDLEDVVDRPH